jgi:ribosome-associated heat shock protein Hsp15
MDPAGAIRIDKWLWAVRAYKTRSLAAEACRAGHVKIAGESVKASRLVRLNEIVSAQQGFITRTVKVLGLLERRIGAKLVAQYLEDQTPASEYQRAREESDQRRLLRQEGAGRPTKKERRALQRFLALPPDTGE